MSLYFSSSLLLYSDVTAPTLRPSLRQALQPEAIEEVVIRCVVKHLGLAKSVHRLEILQAMETEGEEYRYLCDVMREVFMRLNGLIRQLQTMAEMEQKWAHELDGVREGVLQPSAAFFNDFHLQEVLSVLHVCNVVLTFMSVDEERKKEYSSVTSLFFIV